MELSGGNPGTCARRLTRALLLGGLGLCGCGSADDTRHLALAPPSARLAAPGAPYLVQPGDVLAIKVYLAPELDETVAVRPDGRISTALVQDQPAAGRPPSAIAQDLQAAYASELQAPRLTVELARAAPLRVVVTGEVATPGEIVSDGYAPSLLQAVARAGGLRPSADPARVMILRRGTDGRPVLYRTLFAQAQSGASAEGDVTLAPYDIVIVPRSATAQAALWVNQHIQQFIPVSWGFAYEVNPANGTTRR